MVCKITLQLFWICDRDLWLDTFSDSDPWWIFEHFFVCDWQNKYTGVHLTLAFFSNWNIFMWYEFSIALCSLPTNFPDSCNSPKSAMHSSSSGVETKLKRNCPFVHHLLVHTIWKSINCHLAFRIPIQHIYNESYGAEAFPKPLNVVYLCLNTFFL